MNPGRRYEFTPRAIRDFRDVDTNMQRRILDGLDRLCGDPPRGDVRKLQGVADEWRLRVGDWRVRFTYDPEGTLVVLRVLPRDQAYRE